MDSLQRSALYRVAATATLILLSACGGGGGDESTPTPAPPPATTAPAPQPTVITQPLTVTVIDGAIRNALVCVDRNLNGECDPSEPSGKTDVTGTATLQVATTDLGKYPILAVVGTDAVDAENGPVTTAFVMKAPADNASLVSPLTTLVQTTIESTGVSTATAEATVQDQIGLKATLFQDFTKASTSDGQTLARLARLVTVTTQEQTKVANVAVGTKSIDGSSITQADVNGVVARKMLMSLPDLVSALADTRLAAATTPVQNSAAYTAIAKELSVSASGGLTTSTVATLVGIAKMPDASANGTPAVGGTLAALDYASPQNWFWRAFTGTALQSTPDASGNTRFVDRRTRSVNGVIDSWGAGSDPTRQRDFHWNGASWVSCGLNQENVTSQRDAQGRSTYNYCDNLETGASTRSAFDVGGRPMIDVFNQAVSAGFSNLQIANASAALGLATFPANSTLYYQTTTPISTAPGYYPDVTNQVLNVNANVSAGKTSPDDQAAACWSISFNTPSASYTSSATTLESVIAANGATPCVFKPTAETGPRNEWWSQSTISLGIVGTAAVGGSQSTYYSNNTLLRAGFGPGNAVKYYACQQIASNGSSRNCNLIGTGAYNITSIGDGRVLTLSNPPAQAAALNYQRVFVERGGHVYYGYQSRPTPSNTARINLTATNALFAQLGLAPVSPDVPGAAAIAEIKGTWSLTLDPHGIGGPPTSEADRTADQVPHSL